MNTSFQKLIKVKLTRDYNEKTDIFIPHVVYSIMIVNKHRKVLTSLLITKLKNHKLILEKFWMKKHKIILNIINDLLTFWSNHCDHFDVWRQNKNENEKTSPMHHKTDVKSKSYFEKIHSADLSIIILKRTSSLFSNVKNEK